ncbi:MAG: TolC family protein [Gemmatimonadota bacterium]
MTAGTWPGRFAAAAWAAALALAALLPMAVSGQVAAGPPARLTLDEAITRATANNPAYRQEVNNIELNEIEGRSFWLGFFPQLSVSVLNTNMQWNRTAVSTDIFGNPIANPDFRMVQSATSSQRLQLNWSVALGDYFERRANRLRAENRLAQLSDQGEILALDIRLNFLDAQERLEARALEETLLEVRRALAGLTDQRFRLGLADRVELLEAELDVVTQENEFEQSRTNLATIHLQLRNRIGDDSLGEFEIVPEPLRLFDPAVLDQEALVEAAGESGPAVRQARYTLADREVGIPLARSTWLPTFSLFASTDRQEISRESGSGFLQPLPDADWSRRFGLTISFPDIGTWFTRQNEVRRTELDVRNAEEALRATGLSIREEARRLLVELENQYRTLRLQERRAELAAERLELQQEYFRLGRVDYLDLQNSAEASANALRQVLQARYAFERALIQLERALGAPVPTPEAR